MKIKERATQDKHFVAKKLSSMYLKHELILLVIPL